MSRLLVVGVLSAAMATPLYAESPNVSSFEWFAPSCAAAQPTRTGFLLPTLAAPARGGVARIAVTSNVFHGVVPLKVSRAAARDQASSTPQKSWFGRHWKWVVIPTVAVIATVVFLDVVWGCAGC